MTMDTKILLNKRRVPVVAFFGTKGGVGKTTIARRFAELVTKADSRPNVLLVDADVHHRGMTVEMSSQTPVTCKTVHDYIASRNTSEVEAADLTGLVGGDSSSCGRLLFIPASTPEADHIFAKSAEIGPENLLSILHAVVQSAVQTYDCRCVVIDCGPIIDPYTAGGAMLADRAFIIGQNEAISFSSLKTYPNRIRDFYGDFSTSKMKVIINKVRGWEMLEQRKLQEDIFHAIPFTLEIVDASEGIDINQMALMMFESHIAQVVEKVFQADHKELIPPRQTVLPNDWKPLVDNAEQVTAAPAYRRLGLLRLLLPVGLITLAIGGFLFWAGSTQRHRAETAAQTAALVNVLKPLAAQAQAEKSPQAGLLEQALKAAETVDPNSAESLDAALKVAESAGVKDLPTKVQKDVTQENTGIGIFLGGLVLGGIGFFSWRTRKSYETAIQGLRKGGAKWLMQEMQTKQSMRKLFDRMRRMVQTEA